MISKTPFGVLLCAALSLQAQDFKVLEQKVTDFALGNGLRFVVAERHDAPVVSFVTHVAAGTASDSPGLTGLAQLFERLAFKGADSIGTVDAAAEKKALDALEDAYLRLDAEQAKGPRASDLEIVRLEREVRQAANLAQSFIRPREFLTILDENGATAAAARVGADATQIHVSFPSNRTELWFLLESQRISRPVFRDFYQERDGVAQEQRARGDLNFNAKVLQALAAAAFSAHPYRNPPTGWPGELAQLRHADARQFFNRYYVPANITVGIAGDIRPDEVRRLAEKYFGPMPARPLPPPSRIQEPPQTGPRTVVVENSLEPWVGIAFKRPDQLDRDDAVLEVTRSILVGGRSSMLSKELIDTRRTAGTVSILSTFPAGRSPHLFAIVVSALPGHTAEENEQGVSAVVARLQTQAVEEADLARAKSRTRLALTRRLADNTSIAMTLAHYAAEYGDWRKVFAAAEALGKVTAAQVQLAAAKYFTPSRRTTVLMIPPTPVRTEAPKGASARGAKQ